MADQEHLIRVSNQRLVPEKLRTEILNLLGAGGSLRYPDSETSNERMEIICRSANAYAFLTVISELLKRRNIPHEIIEPEEAQALQAESEMVIPEGFLH